MRLSERQMNVLVGSALLALLPLAWLQYRWISEVSEADRQRRHGALQAALERIAADADRDAGRLHAAFVGGAALLRLPLAERILRAKDLDEGVPLKQILFLQRAPGRGWETEAWDEEKRAFVAAETPEWWRGQPFRNGPVHANPPALLGPAFGEEEGERGFVVLLLDTDKVQNEYLPQLIRRHLGESYLDEYSIDVVRQGEETSADASVGIFRQLGRRGPPGRRKGRQAKRPPPDEPGGDGIWRLEARHKDGSLEEAVARTRQRNLLVSFATLVLMGLALTALGIALRRAQRLARLQLEFTAGVSHELRTPLAVIVSAGDNLAGGFVRNPEKVREYGALVRDEGTRLTGMVDQVLRFSALEAERIPLEKRTIQIADLMANVEREMRPLAEAQSVAWESTFTDATFSGDADALYVALRNLVENALRHGGGQWIGLRAGPEENAIVFTVEDRGSGIAASDLPHLFDPFYRGVASREQQRKGSGLGLALVDRIARAHGGSVKAANVPGGGARFTMTIPCE